MPRKQIRPSVLPQAGDGDKDKDKASTSAGATRLPPASTEDEAQVQPGTEGISSG